MATAKLNFILRVDRARPRPCEHAALPRPCEHEGRHRPCEHEGRHKLELVRCSWILTSRQPRRVTSGRLTRSVISHQFKYKSLNHKFVKFTVTMSKNSQPFTYQCTKTHIWYVKKKKKKSIPFLGPFYVLQAIAYTSV